MARGSKYGLFWKFSGEDRQILKNCSAGIQLRFAASGLIISLLFVSGVISYHHTFFQIFNIPYLSWVLGVLFSLMIFNIYKLNLITISTNPDKKGIGYFVSLSCRICFMLLLGLTIIKPLETLILKRALDLELAYLKVGEIDKATRKTAAHFDDAIDVSDSDIKALKEQLVSGRIRISQDKLDQIESKKQKLLNDKKALIEETEKRIDESPHYIRGLLLLNSKFKWVWYISIGFLFLFLLPLFLKYFMSRTSTYVRNMTLLDKKIILEEYENLKLQYPLVFEKAIGEQIHLEERYEDPPFNLVPITIELKTGEEEDFLNHLYGP
ncbi:DUF4407 domain-containing protein [Maribacter sp. 2307UL18-2]|uniref:DUF4407 domain-containing protein n=1 Tax=Maribacter sp. 2307UL18-2 TaxID=3386274 RepID=UPI0039BC3690